MILAATSSAWPSLAARHFVRAAMLLSQIAVNVVTGTSMGFVV